MQQPDLVVEADSLTEQSYSVMPVTRHRVSFLVTYKFVEANLSIQASPIHDGLFH